MYSANLDKFENKELEISDGAMIMAMGNQQTIDSFGDVQLHIEWLSPTPSDNTGRHGVRPYSSGGMGSGLTVCKYGDVATEIDVKCKA